MLNGQLSNTKAEYDGFKDEKFSEINHLEEKVNILILCLAFK
jgi:hypothetical protein